MKNQVICRIEDGGKFSTEKSKIFFVNICPTISRTCELKEN